MTSQRLRAIVMWWLPHAAAALALGVLLVWDREVYRAIGALRSPFTEALTGRVAHLHGAAFPVAIAMLLIAAGAVFRRRKLRRAGAAMVLTVALAGVVTMVMKEVVARPGPEVDDVRGLSWLDARYGRFPSSHSAITFGAASALAAFLPAAAVPGMSLAVLVCYERIYRGTHFPSDIFAGMWIGIIVAKFVIARLARTSWAEDLVQAADGRAPRRAVSYKWLGRTRSGRDQESAG